MASLKLDFFSKSLMRVVSVQALLPVDKIDFVGNLISQTKPFKTLYLLHGIYGNESGWVSESRIGRFAQDHDLAVIMPAGENHFYTDCDQTGEKYGEFIGKELVDLTRRTFPLSDKREDTFIAGLSMGGYGAIHNGLKYHDTFSHIAGLSSALIIDDEVVHSDNSAPIFPFTRRYYEHIFGNLDELIGSERDYRAQIQHLKESGAEIPKFYLCCGTEDFMLEKNRAFRDFLQKETIDLTYEEGSGSHDWDFWDTYIQKVIDWLPLEEAHQGVGDGNVQ